MYKLKIIQIAQRSHSLPRRKSASDGNTSQDPSRLGQGWRRATSAVTASPPSPQSVTDSVQIKSLSHFTRVTLSRVYGGGGNITITTKYKRVNE
jgi:carbamate kinase